MFCTISNEICTHPVVSKRTGHIYEKSLLEKHLQVTGRCPVTEDEMTMDDVVDIQGYQQPAQPRPPTASSIPALLKTFQNEWDQTMIESYKLKQLVQQLREQLSHQLYQHDAACRVIARLTQERDRALQQLANTQQTMAHAIHDANNLQSQQQQQQQLLQQNQRDQQQQQQSQEKQRAESKQDDIDMDGSQNQNGDNGNVSNGSRNTSPFVGIGSGETIQDIVQCYDSDLWNATEASKEVINAITENSTKLSTARRKHKKTKNENLTKPENLSHYSVVKQFELHSEQDTGISCMDMPKIGELSNYTVSGGYDCKIIITNRNTGSFEHILEGHTKKVTNVEFHSKYPIILSGSADSTIRMWRYNNDASTWVEMLKLNKIHKDSVTGLQFHCLDLYFGSCSYDGSWCLHSLKGNTLIQKYESNDNNTNSNKNKRRGGFSCLSMHPDGNLMGTGCVNQNAVKIWDLRNSKDPCATFEGHTGLINDISFNENGYYLGSCDDNGICKIYDLRKIGKQGESHTINEFENNRIKTIAFDQSGTYLAIGQSYGIELFQCKKWNKIATLRNHNKDVTSIRFGPHARYITTSSRDGKLNTYSLRMAQ